MSSNAHVKIKDLPIYGRKEDENAILVILDTHKKNAVEQAITDVRLGTTNFLNQFQDQKNKTVNAYNTSLDTLNKQLEYIRSESNILPKVDFVWKLKNRVRVLVKYWE